MNFKKQMQQAYLKNNVSSYTSFISGSYASLSSDLVKGLVEAGDKVLEWWKQDDEIGVLNADDVMDILRTALTNYKQEINHLNEKQ